MSWVSDLFEYAKAVGNYWWAIFGWVTFVTGDGANWFGAKDWLDRKIAVQHRRKLEIAIMVGLVFYAGFEAWNDQHGKLQTTGDRLQYWQGVAEARREQIEGKEGNGGLQAALRDAQRGAATSGPPPSVIRPKPHLGRLIAYDGPSIYFDPNAPNGPMGFLGVRFPTRNVSSETISIEVAHLSVSLDGALAMRGDHLNKGFLPQTQTMPFNFKRIEGVLPVSQDNKTITVEFEVDYDTVPATGIRRSYRKIAYPLTWPNGPKGEPQSSEPQMLDSWER